MALTSTVGSLVNEVSFKIDTASWNNLKKFNEKLAETKRLMTSLRGGISLRVSGNQQREYVRTVQQMSQRASQTLFADRMRQEEAAAKKRQKIENTIQTRSARTSNIASGLGRLNPQQIQAFARSQRQLNQSFRTGALSLTQYRIQSDSLSGSYRVLNNQTRTLSQRFRSLRGNIIAGGAAFALFQGASNIEQIGQKFDSIDSVMLGATGDVSKAQSEMQFLRDTTNKWGTDLLSSAKGFAHITAAAQGTKIETQDVHALITAMTKASVGFGLSADDTFGAMKAIIQMINKGQVYAEELKGQLGERLIGTLPLAAEAWGLGKTEDGVKKFLKLMEKGEISAEQFVKKFAPVLDQFADGAATSAMTKNRAAMSRMKNTYNDFANDIHKSGFGQMMMHIYHSLENIMVAAGPLANFLSTTLNSAFTTLLFPLNLAIAHMADFVELFGIDFQGDLALVLAEVLGLIVGLWGMAKIGKLLKRVYIGLGTTLATVFGAGKFKALFKLVAALTTLVGLEKGLTWLQSGTIEKDINTFLGSKVLGKEGSLEAKASEADTIRSKINQRPAALQLLDYISDGLNSAMGMGKYDAEYMKSMGSTENIRKNSSGVNVNIKVSTDGSKLAEAVNIEVENNNESMVQDIKSNAGL